MSIALVDMKIKGVKTFQDDTFNMDFRNEKRVSRYGVDEHLVSNMAGSNYRNHVIALAGINASGKTTSLKLIQFVLRVFISGQSLNPCEQLYDLFRDKVNVQLNLVVDNYLVNLEAKLLKETKQSSSSPVLKDSNTFGGRLIFSDEIFKKKELISKETKESFLKFDGTESCTQRSQLDKEMSRFLKDDDSMLPSLIEKDIYRSPFISSIFSDTTYPNDVWEAMLTNEVLSYLDDSIESLIPVDADDPARTNKTAKVKLKFYGQNEIEILYSELDNFISSGTIRGISVFSEILMVLSFGGYLLIDELEIHFNKVIVENIISFFQSEININGATLIFTTHYSEILDAVKRTEAIKVLAKDGNKIKISSLASLLKNSKKDRSDVKSSDLILSGIFNTAPSYNKYRALYKQVSTFDSVL